MGKIIETIEVTSPWFKFSHSDFSTLVIWMLPLRTGELHAENGSHPPAPQGKPHLSPLQNQGREVFKLAGLGFVLHKRLISTGAHTTFIKGLIGKRIWDHMNLG